VLRVGDEFLSNFSQWAEHAVYVSDGTADVFAAHDVYLNRLARNIAPVRLTGKFGSEILRDRTSITLATFPEDFIAEDVRREMSIARTDFRDLLRQYDGLSFAAFVEVPHREHGKAVTENSQLVVRTPYIDVDLIRLMYSAPHDVRRSPDLQWTLIHDAHSALARIPTNRGPGFPASLLGGAVRRSICRASLALDYRYYGDTSNALVRFQPLLRFTGIERTLFGYQKFERYPFWLRKELSPFLKDLLLSSKVAPDIFQTRSVERLVAEHTTGLRNHAKLLNKALTLELIARLLISRNYLG
jgi:asparagine synthase (glutamine-hydrolysing)